MENPGHFSMEFNTIVRDSDGTVVNVVEGEYPPPAGYTRTPEIEGASIGWVIEGGVAQAPADTTVPSEISPRQLMLGLVAAGWITSAEGVAWSQRISLPAVFETILAGMSEAQATGARITAYAMASSLRSDPFLRLAAEASMPAATPAEVDAALDDAFREWATL